MTILVQQVEASSDAEKVRRLMAYDPETGILTRKVSACSTARAGDVVGWQRKDGYLRGRLDGRSYMLHRLAWLHYYGEWPANQIDHINGVRNDNRIANLRDVTHKQNSRNQRRKCTNLSGVTGVQWAAYAGKWRAFIRVDGKHLGIGYFDTIEAAAEARKQADLTYAFHPNHGTTERLS